jgi:hypothetical protein
MLHLDVWFSIKKHSIDLPVRSTISKKRTIGLHCSPQIAKEWNFFLAIVFGSVIYYFSSTNISRISFGY